MKEAKRYCNYCGKRTKHEVESNDEGNEDGTCKECGSSHPTKIQGFNANLM